VGGRARLRVVTTGKFGRVLARDDTFIEPDAEIDLPFRLRLMDAALTTVEFAASGTSGCVLLQAVDWTRLP
jgi:hypothetical protein